MPTPDQQPPESHDSEVTIDQHLMFGDAHGIVLTRLDEPGLLVQLVLEVEHIETGHKWTQSVHLTHPQLRVLDALVGGMLADLDHPGGSQ